MKKLIDYLMVVVKKYTVLDFVFFKIALASFGILLGAYLSQFFLSIIAIVWIVFIISYIYVMYRTFRKDK